MSPLAFWATSVLAASAVYGSPVLEARQGTVTTLTAAQIAAFTPYAWYASAAYCSPSSTLAWNCGRNCQGNPGFKPVASGGDGAFVQYWYVGYDPALQTVIVGHQGTDAGKIVPIVTDANFTLSALSASLFPGVSSSVKTHSGFRESQADTAAVVLAAVKTTISTYAATKVTVLGHSLGGAISVIDTLYLKLNLPTTISFQTYTFGAPRVGNQAFATLFDTTFPGRIARVNNEQDLVPILPGRFLGFKHTDGEKHILDSGAWVACAGQDNTNSLCTTGEVGNIFEGETGDHSGPYGPVSMGC